MIIHASAPNRILDIGSWSATAFAEHGAVLNCAVSLYARVTIRALRHGGTVVFGRQQAAAHDDVQCILSLDLSLSEFIRAAKHYFEIDGLEILVSSDLPSGYGTGTTAAVRVAMVAALAHVVGERLTPQRIALIAHRLQCEEVGLACGLQSYLAAATGGLTLDRITPYPRVFNTHSVLADPQLHALEQRCLIVQTGRRASHNLYTLLEKRLQAGDRKVAEVIWRLRALPARAMEAITQTDWETLGATMAEQWMLQLRLFPALSTPEVRHISHLASRYGALATMVNGSGGSVTILNARDDNSALRRELLASGYHVLPVRIARQGVSVRSTDPIRFRPPLPRCCASGMA